MSPRPLPPSGEQIEIAHDAQRATVVEVGGALRTYSQAGREILDGYGEDEMCPSARGQTLLPWPNRLRDGRYSFDGRAHQLPLSEPDKGNAIHGLVRWANWTVAERERERVVMSHLLHPQSGFPFALALSNEYVLSADGLSVTVTATNRGATACPYGAGAHPYLTVGSERLDGDRLTIPAGSWLRSDERQIPLATESVQGSDYDFRVGRAIGDAQLDTAYTDLIRDDDGRARVVLAAPEGGPAVALWMDRSYGYVMAFTGDSLPDPARRRRGLGVEPMTCAPNAFQSGEGLLRLEPGDRAVSRWGILPDAG
jgi:aldose 1-epimerase